ncbi:MAG: hypothetical protein HN952_03965 [Candidatus Cloacimonetes bacterium]|jgi:hypothetical protein|nr:hypothetical protein [Candidatus Cloacimonadota bacterium]MBT6994093.1 hypothetical protein [Candidatus Cloacimonadota bacterium]MBT7468978.1 hypothetical protein [Candidatus Cloacimonadota bacterium]
MKNKIILFFLTILFGCSTTPKYDLAHQYYQQKKYLTAIYLFDEFVETEANTALATESILQRSEAYYQLGFTEFQSGNWELASKYFYLANSQKADELQDNCYFQMAKKHHEKNNIDDELFCYNYIFSYLPQSEFIAEILYNRILIYLEQDEKYLILTDFHFLWSHYPQNEYTKKLQPKIDELMTYFIGQSSEYDVDKSLDLLFRLSKYPTDLKEVIFTKIGDIYILKAQIAFSENDVQNAEIYFGKVVEFAPLKMSEVIFQKQKMCSIFIEKGDEYLAEFLFDEANLEYQKSFVLLPKCEYATTAIEKMKTTQLTYNTALEHEKKASQFEFKNDFENALKWYKSSYSFFEIEKVSQKIEIMQNLCEAQNNPRKFALKIVFEYENGKLNKEINGIIAEAKAEHQNELVKTSNWKVVFAIGEYNYEIRYDIITPKKSYYFAWRVDLKNRKLTPVNKISEKLMEN